MKTENNVFHHFYMRFKMNVVNDKRFLSQANIMEYLSFICKHFDCKLCIYDLFLFLYLLSFRADGLL